MPEPGLDPDLRPEAHTRPLDLLIAEHYTELLAMARRERHRSVDATLDTRAVLHEAFLRLVRQRQTEWSDDPHFLAAAAGTMRRVVLDHVRRRRAARRGNGRPDVTLDADAHLAESRDDTLVALDDALDELAAFAPRLARVVECRYFGGMTEVETATALGVTERTVRRDWIKARGWLHSTLSEDDAEA